MFYGFNFPFMLCNYYCVCIYRWRAFSLPIIIRIFLFYIKSLLLQRYIYLPKSVTEHNKAQQGCHRMSRKWETQPWKMTVSVCHLAAWTGNMSAPKPHTTDYAGVHQWAEIHKCTLSPGAWNLHFSVWIIWHMTWTWQDKPGHLRRSVITQPPQCFFFQSRQYAYGTWGSIIIF